MEWNVLYCTLLYCSVLFCTVLYFTLQYTSVHGSWPNLFSPLEGTLMYHILDTRISVRSSSSFVRNAQQLWSNTNLLKLQNQEDTIFSFLFLVSAWKVFLCKILLPWKFLLFLPLMYGRHWISWRVGIVAPRPKTRMRHFFLHISHITNQPRGWFCENPEMVQNVKILPGSIIWIF